TITYSVTNVGEETINLAKTPLSVTTDNGGKFTSTGKLNHYAHNVLVNGYKLKVGKKLQGKLVLLSSHKLDISSIQLNIGTQVPYNSIDDTAEVLVKILQIVLLLLLLYLQPPLPPLLLMAFLRICNSN